MRRPPRPALRQDRPVPDPSSLTAWLAEQEPARRRRLVAHAGLAAGYQAEPRMVAARLSQPDVVLRGIAGLDAFAGALLEVLLLGGLSTGRAELDAAVDGRASAAQVDAALERLEERGLAWRHPGGVRVQGGARAVLLMPCGLGQPLEQLLQTASPPDVVAIAHQLGVALGRPGPATVGLLVTAVLARLPDTLAALPPEAAELLGRLCVPGARLGFDDFPGVAAPKTAQGWLRSHGLLVVQQWSYGEVPREVCLAVRGGRVLLQVEPEQPPLGPPADPAQGAADAGLAATAVLSDARLLLARLHGSAPTLRKDGALGVRELRRIAKDTGLAVARVRLGLGLLVLAGAASADGAELRQGRAADAWSEADPAAAWQRLVTPWLQAGQGLLAGAEGDPLLLRPAPPWMPERPLGPLPLLRALAGSPARVDVDSLRGWLGWGAPYADPVPDLPGELAALLDEATALGLLARGVPTPVGLLAATDVAAAAAALAPSLPLPQASVVLQADLTATVAGPPATATARLLDTLGTRESSGHATVWRLSPAGARRWLDEGGSAEELLAALADVAEQGVPVGIATMVADAARRHGELVVHEGGSVIVARDPATAAMAVRDRRLVALGVREVAPGVLVARAGHQEVLAALRAAGLHPAAGSGGGPARQVVDATLAREVQWAVLLPRREVTVLIKAAREARPIEIEHAEIDGRVTRRVLSGVELRPPHLRGLAGDDGQPRSIRLDALLSVSAAAPGAVPS